MKQLILVFAIFGTQAFSADLYDVSLKSCLKEYQTLSDTYQPTKVAHKLGALATPDRPIWGEYVGTGLENVSYAGAAAGFLVFVSSFFARSNAASGDLVILMAKIFVAAGVTNLTAYGERKWWRAKFPQAAELLILELASPDFGTANEGPLLQTLRANCSQNHGVEECSQILNRVRQLAGDGELCMPNHYIPIDYFVPSKK